MEKSKLSEYIDTEYSSGDSKMMQSKQKHKEENNNEVDELTKDFSEMGCIVDPAKRPSNICIENCVYEESSEGEDQDENDDADGYSDEFEEDKSEDEELKTEHTQIETNKQVQSDSDVKLVKSQSSMSSRAPASLSGGSTGYGSITTRPRRRVNMSFTNDRLREIERHNHILLQKIMTARNEKKSSIPTHEQPRKMAMPSAAVQRKQLQKKIDHENLILLKKIQRAKSSACSMRR